MPTMSGKKFPEEARKMHYGEIEHRSIYGEASLETAKELSEEGIELHPLAGAAGRAELILGGNQREDGPSRVIAYVCAAGER